MILNKQIFNYELTRELSNFSYQELKHSFDKPEYNGLYEKTIEAKKVIDIQVRSGKIEQPPKIFTVADFHLMRLCLDHSINYKIEDNIRDTLFNTDSDSNNLHLPNPAIFLDVEIQLLGGKILGIFLLDKSLIDVKISGDNSSIKKYLSESQFNEYGYDIYFVLYNEKSQKNFIHAISSSKINYTNPEMVLIKDKGKTDKELEEIKASNMILYKRLIYFTKSFLNFLYNPDVQICKKEYTSIRKKRREEEGKSVEDHHYLRITGKTRKYLDELNIEHFSENYLKSNESVLVRGFYRTLSSDYYKEKRGLRIFIAPYVRGNLDNITNKEYIVSERKFYYHEELMKSYIRNLFPSHLILDNTRGFLDGLEIDCYIPSLKLGFEYDGEQHYVFPNAYHKTKKEFREQQKRDKLKRRIAQEKGIKIITVRYDEDLSKELIKSNLDKLI